MLSIEFFVYSKLHGTHSEKRDQRMRQVDAYERLTTMALTVRLKKWSRSHTGGDRLL